MARKATATATTTTLSSSSSPSSFKPSSKSTSSKKGAAKNAKTVKNNNINNNNNKTKSRTNKANPPPILSPKSNTLHSSENRNPLLIHSSDASEDDQSDQSDQESSLQSDHEQDNHPKLQSTPIKRRANGKTSPLKKGDNSRLDGKGKGRLNVGSSKESGRATKQSELTQEDREMDGNPPMPEHQIQAALAAYDLECEARLRRIRQQLDLSIATTQIRHNTLMSRMPSVVKQMTIGEFVDLYDADVNKAMTHNVKKKAEIDRKQHETSVVSKKEKRRFNSQDEDGVEQEDGKQNERKGKAARIDREPVASASKPRTKAAPRSTAASSSRKASNSALSRNKSQPSKPPSVTSTSSHKGGTRPPSISKFNPNLPSNLPRPPTGLVYCRQLANGEFVPVEEESEISIYEEAVEGNEGEKSNEKKLGNGNELNLKDVSKKKSMSIGKKNHSSFSSSSSSSQKGRIPFPSTSDQEDQDGLDDGEDDDDDDDDDDDLPDEEAYTAKVLRDEMAKVALSSPSSAGHSSEKKPIQRNRSSSMDEMKGTSIKNDRSSKSSSNVSRPPVTGAGAGAGAGGMKGKSRSKATKNRDSFVSRKGEEIPFATATPKDLEGLSPDSKKQAALALRRHHLERAAQWQV